MSFQSALPVSPSHPDALCLPAGRLGPRLGGLILGAVVLTLSLAICSSVSSQTPKGARSSSESSAAPTGTQPQTDVPYAKTSDGQSLRMDVFQPQRSADASPRAAVLMIHGGGWAGGDKKDFHPLGKGLAHLGYVAFAVQYRLTSNPKNIWPSQLDDVQLAIRWIRSHAAIYGVDPARIGAIGMSAGGHLAACLGTLDTRDPINAPYGDHSSRVQCVVNVCGPVILTEDLSTKVRQGAAVNNLVKNLLGGTAAERADAARQASPLLHVDSKSAPFLILHGRQDDIVPVEHSERLHAALRKADINARLVVFDDEGHNFSKPETQERFIQETITFFQQELD